MNPLPELPGFGFRAIQKKAGTKSFKPVATLLCALVLAATPTKGVAQLMISGNESKIDLSEGGPQVVAHPEPDSLTFLDFSQFPPKVEHLADVPNTVIGPPSNIAITPNHELALIADSIRLDPNTESGWGPENKVHLLDLTVSPPRLLGAVQAGDQPSGMSISSDGKLALVANRAGGTVSILKIDGKRVSNAGSVTVCEPEESASDVAIHPEGNLALVSVQQGGYLALLDIQDGKVTNTDRKVSVYGKPYRCVITPDGSLGLTAGAGFGNGPDADALSVVDLTSDPVRTIDHIAIPPGPESLEVSPDGRLIAVVVMAGSNLASDDPNRTEHGRMIVFRRNGKKLTKSQELNTGRIPEGVAFSTDGKYLVVQCHPARELWVYRVENGKVSPTDVRIQTPGMPSSLRAAP